MQSKQDKKVFINRLSQLISVPTKESMRRFFRLFFFCLAAAPILNPFHRLCSIGMNEAKAIFLCQEFSIDKNIVCHNESHFNQFFESFTVISSILGWKKFEEFIEQSEIHLNPMLMLDYF